MRHCQDSSLLPLHLENFFLIHSQTLVICKMLSREWNTLCHAFHWHAASAPCGPTHSTSGRERCYIRNIALDNQHVANSCKIARAANYYCCLLRHTGRSIGAILSPWGYGAGHYERSWTIRWPLWKILFFCVVLSLRYGEDIWHCGFSGFIGLWIFSTPC